jgi:Family of unknown function (DUF5678)
MYLYKVCGMPELLLQNELEKLKRFERNSEWFQSHYEELWREYKDEYIAIDIETNSTGPVDHDKNYETLIKRLREKYGDLSSFVIEPVYEQRPIDIL